VTVNGSKTYFDTNVSDHHHFFIENEHNLVEYSGTPIEFVGQLPQVPEGYEKSAVSTWW